MFKYRLPLLSTTMMLVFSSHAAVLHPYFQNSLGYSFNQPVANTDVTGMVSIAPKNTGSFYNAEQKSQGFSYGIEAGLNLLIGTKWSDAVGIGYNHLARQTVEGLMTYKKGTTPTFSYDYQLDTREVMLNNHLSYALNNHWGVVLDNGFGIASVAMSNLTTKKAVGSHSVPFTVIGKTYNTAVFTSGLGLSFNPTSDLQLQLSYEFQFTKDKYGPSESGYLDQPTDDPKQANTSINKKPMFAAIQPQVVWLSAKYNFQ